MNIFISSFSGPAYTSCFRVITAEEIFGPRNSILGCYSKYGLLERNEFIHVNNKWLTCHAPVYGVSRNSYSRAFSYSFPSPDFRIVGSKNRFIYNKADPCVDSVFKSLSCKTSMNESSWTAAEIAEAVDGEIINWGPSGTICTDSRKLNSGQWFFTIVGENFDGHDFVNQALEDKGCVGVIGNDICENWQRGFVKFNGNTLIALQKLAKYARKRFGGHVVGVTGSVGKTTTRTMISLALQSLGQVYQTQENQNNQIGVALTLIGIPCGAQVSVVELGMSRKGEILELAQMCQPCVRVILNVAHCHMENFRSLEGISDAKGELLVDSKPGNVCVLNADDPLIMRLPVPIGVRKISAALGSGSEDRLVTTTKVGQPTSRAEARRGATTKQSRYRPDLRAVEPHHDRRLGTDQSPKI